MIKRISIHIIFVCLTYIVFSQSNLSYDSLMQEAFFNRNYQLATDIYLKAEKEDYYNLTKMQITLSETYYLLGKYKDAIDICKIIQDNGDNTNMIDIMHLVCLSKVKAPPKELVAVIEQFVSSPLQDNIFHKLKALSDEDLDFLIDNLTKIGKQRLVSSSYKQEFNTLMLILNFYREQYMIATNYSDCIKGSSQGICYYIFGVLYEKNGEYLAAINMFNKAVQKDYTYYETYLHRAICEGYQEDYIGSNIDLDTCLQIDSNFYPYYLKGINFNLMEEYESSLKAIDMCLKLNIMYAPAYNYRGIVNVNKGDDNFAILDFEQAVLLDKKMPFLHNNLGLTYERVGKIQKAIKQYELSIEYEPELAEAYYHLGRIYTLDKKTAKAIKLLKKAKELDPSIPDTYYLLGLNYQNRHRKSKACEYFHKALDLNHSLAQDKIDTYCEGKKPLTEEELLEKELSVEHNQEDQIDNTNEDNLDNHDIDQSQDIDNQQEEIEEDE